MRLVEPHAQILGSLKCLNCTLLLTKPVKDLFIVLLNDTLVFEGFCKSGKSAYCYSDPHSDVAANCKESDEL